MQLPFAFNPGTVQPSQALDVMPAGWYPAKGITESEVADTSTGGKQIKATVELQNGRKVWLGFNIVNSSQKAVEMAYADLAALCGAIGIQQQITDTTQLHNRPFDVKLRVQQDEGYDPRNTVATGGFAPLGTKADKYAQAAAPAPQLGGAPAFAPAQPAAFGQPQQPAFQPPAPVQQPMPQPPQQFAQHPQAPAQFQPQAQPAQQFAQQPAQQQQWNPAAMQPPAQPQQFAQPQAQAQGFQPHPGAPAWTQPR